MSVYEMPAAGLSIQEIEHEIERLLTKADSLSRLLEERRQELHEDEAELIAWAAQSTKRVLRRTA